MLRAEVRAGLLGEEAWCSCRSVGVQWQWGSLQGCPTSQGSEQPRNHSSPPLSCTGRQPEFLAQETICPQLGGVPQVTWRAQFLLSGHPETQAMWPFFI